MSKRRRAAENDPTPDAARAAPTVTDGSRLRPPRRRKWLLVLSAVLVACWLIVLLCLAIQT